ncbi:xanthine/uracil permease [Aphelenchoides avenae]|nr:xanthine/uracil permease [Aphelenchus avenae]
MTSTRETKQKLPSEAGSSEDTSGKLKLEYRTTENPPLKMSFFYACQQVIVCTDGALSTPFIVATLACAGAATMDIRSRLISTTFFVTGISTLLQSTIGLRLAILQGPSFAYLPPLMAFAMLPDMACNVSETAKVPTDVYLGKINMVAGSLAAASMLQILAGAFGIAGLLSRRVGPITIVPLLLLLCISAIDPTLKLMTKHWISLVQVDVALNHFFVCFTCAVMYPDALVPLPYITRQGVKVKRARLLGELPFLFALLISWSLAAILSFTGVEAGDSAARVDTNQSVAMLHNSPWFRVPYPGQFGPPSFHAGLFLGFLASSAASAIESMGVYDFLANLSNEGPPPASALNRAISLQGFSALLAGLTGCGLGNSAYAGNVVLITVTRVASRLPLQLAGLILILLGLFSKTGALLATIPEPIIGSILAMCLCMIAGLCLYNLAETNIRSARNLNIIGVAFIGALGLGQYIENNPIKTGIRDLDQMLNMMLTLRLFVGGFIGFVLDNVCGGATLEERGFRFKSGDAVALKQTGDGYSFPSSVNRFLLRHNLLRMVPFVPSEKRLRAALDADEVKNVTVRKQRDEAVVFEDRP